MNTKDPKITYEKPISLIDRIVNLCKATIQYGSLASLAVLLIKNKLFPSKIKTSNFKTLAVFASLYFIHIVVQLGSKTFFFLLNKHNSHTPQTIHTYMKMLFKSPINILFKIQCYHYEKVKDKKPKENKESQDDKTSKEKQKTQTKKIVSFEGSQSFFYNSWRDISGVFLLDSAEILRSKKAYIKLHLGMDYNCFDDITLADLNSQRNIFFNENKWRDKEYETSTSLQMNNFSEYNLIKMSDETPIFFNAGWYILFTLLSVRRPIGFKMERQTVYAVFNFKRMAKYF